MQNNRNGDVRIYKIGIDIGGTKINIGLFDAEKKALIDNEKTYISDIKDMKAHISQTIRALCEKNGADFEQVTSVGMGIPGTVSDDGKQIVMAPNISLEKDFAVQLEAYIGLPVTLVQDSRAAAWGEYLCGAGKGHTCVVCITLGTGIGTGIVMNGEIYAGPLGCAGELGHLPAVEGGRACGCGKNGCVEKYCAGRGLDITAEELLGQGKTAYDLFLQADAGNTAAKNAVSDAVKMLGKAIISALNLLSPDCLLFSGGLSEQEEQFLTPLMQYIKCNCYCAGAMPVMKKAALGALSPMYGAAFVPQSQKRNPALSASVMCADVLNFGQALKEIEAAGIQYIHSDIMDNHFVPNLMLPMEMLNRLHTATSLPFDFHIMAENPETVIEKLDIRPGDFVAVHYESTNHLERVLSLINQRGARAAVAINPATPVEVLKEVIGEIDMVLVMTVNPGFSGQKIVPFGIEKIRRTRAFLDENNGARVIIEVDGNCSFTHVPKMYAAGADIFVVGTSSVFNSGGTIAENCKKLWDSMK